MRIQGVVTFVTMYLRASAAHASFASMPPGVLHRDWWYDEIQSVRAVLQAKARLPSSKVTV